MKTYSFRVWKTVTLEGKLTIDARNEDDAYERASAIANRTDKNLSVMECDVELDLIYEEGGDD
jgi:hypothetical protein